MERNGKESIDAQTELTGEFDLIAILQKYIRYWYLFPIFFVLSAIGAYYYLQRTPPIYRTSASILIKDQKKGVTMGAGDIMSDLGGFSSNKLVENEIKVLTSRTLMEQVVSELNLQVGYFTEEGLRRIDLYKKSPITVIPTLISDDGYSEILPIRITSGETFKIEDIQQTFSFNQSYRSKWGIWKVVRNPEGDTAISEIAVRFYRPTTLASNMSNRLSVEQPTRGSTVLELSFQDPSPRRGVDVINSLLDVYVRSSLADKNAEVSNTLTFLEERLNLVSGELGEVEEDVQTYRNQQGLTDISAESQLFLQNMKDNDSKLNEISTQIKVLESVESYVNNAEENGVAPGTYMIDDPLLVSLINRYTELALQREKLSRTVQSQNPIMETVNVQLENTKRSIKENLRNIRRGLDLTYQNLESVNKRFSAGLRRIPQKEREYVGIKRQQTIKENLYLYLLQKREETALAFAATVTDSRLIDAPISSPGPVRPQKKIVFLGAFLIGLAIPFGVISLLVMLNNRVQSRKEIEQLSGSTIVGEIGKNRKINRVKEDSLIKVSSRSAVAEQFRALRTNLQYIGSGSSKVLMFTSSVGGEGKSFVSTNLAASLAYAGKKVLLIGADLRKPTIHQRLGLINDKGLTNYLIGQGNVGDFIKTSEIHEFFDVILSGANPPNPSELLDNGRLPVLLDEARKLYDYILIDSPPYGLVTDAALISEHVDATLYIVRYNYTIREHLRKIKDLILQKRFKNLSVVFNAVNYGAGYGYGYGYYSEEDSKKTKSLIGKLLSAK